MRISDCGFRIENGPGWGSGVAGLVLVLCSVLLAISTAAQAERIDHIVAAVNNDVITSFDLEQAVSINEVLSGPALDRNRLREETRIGLVNRLLLLQEARRIKIVEVTEQDMRTQVEAFSGRLGSPEALAAFLSKARLSSRDLERMLGERLLVERFIEKKIGLYVRIDRKEAQDYFDSHAARFKGKSFPEAQKQIMSFLADQELVKQVDQYLSELRGKASLRINPL